MVFGKKTKKLEPVSRAPEVPDLVIEQEEEEETVGMPGFTQPVTTKPLPVMQPQAVAPAVQQAVQPVVQQPVVKNTYQVVGAELVAEGIYRYIILTNKTIGDIGEVYEF